MGLFDFFNNDASGRDFVYDMDPGSEHHKAKLSHELIGGAAGFEAMRAYEQHCAREGRPQSHALAKELLAGFASAEVDKIFETKGLDAWDREEAKRHARSQVENALAQSGEYSGGGYGGGEQYGGGQGGYGGGQGGYGGGQGGYGGQQGGYEQRY